MEAARRVAEEEQQQRAWPQSTEFLAEIVELLSAIIQRLNAGIPVAVLKKLDKPDDPIELDRPEWVRRESSAEVVSPADFVRMMRG